MPATDLQVQSYSDDRIRPRSEQARDFYNACKDDKALIDDVYAALSNNPTWVDTRVDAPPHLLAPSDVLAWNAFITAVIDLIEGAQASNFVAVRKACVKPV